MSRPSDIRFARTDDGVNLAYAASGRGPALVRPPNWLTHIEHERTTPIWRPWIERLEKRSTLYRYDARGCGLSDRADGDVTLDRVVRDMEAVVDAAGLERFSLLGISLGGAISIAYAARHPERVTHLVLCGAWARGTLCRNPTPAQVAAFEAMVKLIEVGWGERNSAFVQMFTTQFFPEATREQADSFNEMQRMATSPQRAAKLASAFGAIDASIHLHQITCPTLVLHCTGDVRAPFEEGRYIAGGIRGARFQPLESRNHLPLPGEAVFEQALSMIDGFLPGGEPRSDASFPALTPREREIVELLAQGLDNAQIAARLDLSEKTVRNNVTQVFTKLGVENRPQAIVRAREAGFGSVPARV
jgi:pimeloyl-ACP methyl ester carboxylesterase/DNA-binding CsgD family transcriptional regulator